MIDEAMTTVCLLALRQLGGKDVPAKQDLFTKGLKTQMAQAIAEGLVSAAKIDVVTQKNGKSAKAKIDALSLTPAGEAKLKSIADPEALAATAQGHAVALQKTLEADREKLRGEVLAALAAPAKNKTDPAKEVAGLSKSLQDLAKRLEKIESQMQSSGNDGILQRIDQGFAALQERLGAASIIARPVTPIVAHAQPPATAPAEPDLRKVLKLAYDDLCLLVEYEDRLIPLPRLFHQAKHHMPSLTVNAFHQKLQQLWDERILELQGINEVRTAAEPDKAIQRGDRLLYFVIWR